MFKLNSKTFYLRHNKEIDRFLNDDSEWLDITSVNNPYIENNQNILRIDLDKEVADQFKSYPENSFDLIVLTNIFELTPNIYEFLLSIQKILKEDGRILITSVNPRWNLLLLIFETFLLCKARDSNKIIFFFLQILVPSQGVSYLLYKFNL